MSFSSVLFPRGEESSVLFPRGEDGHQVTWTSNLWQWQSGGKAEQSKKEVEGSAEGEVKAPAETEHKEESIQQYVSRRRRSWKLLIEVEEREPIPPDDEPHIDAVRRQAFPTQASVAQQNRIQEDTTGGKGNPKSGDDGAPRPPKGRSEGKGGKSRQWRNPSGFASHASEEMLIEMDDSRLAMPCGYRRCSENWYPTADENSLTIYPSTHGGDDPSDDYADAYNAQDEDECEDSDEGYDTSGDWNGEEVAANDAGERNKKWSVEDICRSIVEDIVEACELETAKNNVTQDPELCSENIQDYTASVAKSRRGKGKGNKYMTNDRQKMLAESADFHAWEFRTKLRVKTLCNNCGQKGHWRQQCQSGDSLEDAVKCSYMVVKEDEDPASNDLEEDVDKLRYDCELLPLQMKYQQMTFITVFLRRWLQVTAGSKMLNHMSKVTGGIEDTPMETAIMKAIRLTRGLYKPEPVPSMPIGTRNTSMKFIMKIPEFLWQWFQLMEGNRPYRRARLQVSAPRPAQIPYPAGICPIHTGRDDDELRLRVADHFGTITKADNDIWAIIDTGCNTNIRTQKWLAHAKARFAASQENIDKDSDEDINGPIPPHAGGGHSSSSCHWKDVDTTKPDTPSPDSDEDTSSAEAPEVSVPVPASIAATAAAMEKEMENLRSSTAGRSSRAPIRVPAKVYAYLAKSLKQREDAAKAEQDATSRIASSSSTAPRLVSQQEQASTTWDELYGDFPTIRSFWMQP